MPSPGSSPWSDSGAPVSDSREPPGRESEPHPDLHVRMTRNGSPAARVSLRTLDLEMRGSQQVQRQPTHTRSVPRHQPSLHVPGRSYGEGWSWF